MLMLFYGFDYLFCLVVLLCLVMYYNIFVLMDCDYVIFKNLFFLIFFLLGKYLLMVFELLNILYNLNFIICLM